MAHDVATAAERDDLVHRQEVAGVVELFDQRELDVELASHVGRNVVGEAASGAFLDERAQMIGAGGAIGQTLRGIAIAKRAELERAALRELERAIDRGRHVGVETREGVRRAEVVLVVAANARAGGGERDAVADAREHVLQRTARARVIEHLVGCDEREARGLRARLEASFAWNVVGAAMAREEREQTIAERVAQIGDHRGRWLRFAGEQTALASPQCDHAGRALADLAPRCDRRAFIAATPRRREQARDVGPARAILREQHELRGRWRGVAREIDRDLARLASLRATAPAERARDR